MDRFGKVRQNFNGVVWNGWSYLIVLLLAFLTGSAAGFFLACESGSNLGLQDFLNDYFTYAAQGELDVSFFPVLWKCLCWPLLIVAFAFSAFGIVAIPAAFFVRGFLVAYAMSSFAVAFGRCGVLAGLVLLGPTIIFVLPVLFLLGFEGLRSIFLRISATAQPPSGRRFGLEPLLIGFGILSVASAISWTVVPTVFSSLCIRLF